jgi:hypothetical protein
MGGCRWASAFFMNGNNMSAQLNFYRARASEAQAGAAAAELQNVRDRWLSSAASWTELANQSERAELMRQKLIAEKAGERDALEAARVQD